MRGNSADGARESVDDYENPAPTENVDRCSCGSIEWTVEDPEDRSEDRCVECGAKHRDVIPF